MKNILLIALLALIGIESYILYETGTALLISDTSLARSPLDYQPQGSRPPVYLVSYADGHEVFYRNQRTLAHSALGRGFDFVLNYNRGHVDPAFINKNKAIFDQKSGAGMWLWKPWVIKHALKHAPENAIIVYADVGFVWGGIITPLLPALRDSDILLCEYEDVSVYGLQKRATTRAVFKKLNADRPAVWNDKRVIGGFLMLKNTQNARDFIDEWLTNCQDIVMLTGKGDTNDQFPEFRNHHHDQSILGVMAALRKDIVRMPYDGALTGSLAVWHHRRPGAKPNDPTFIWSTLSHHYAHGLDDSVHKIYNWIAYKLYGSS